VDSREAKEILALRRRGREDAGDPRFAEALELARTDPALADWLERQTAFDAAVGEELRRIPVPADLRERILARRPASSRATASWRQPWSYAAAAAVAAVAVVAGLWLARPPVDFDTYRREMTGVVAGEYEIEFKTSQLDAIRSYLASHGSPSDYALTPAMKNLELEGASALRWRGRNVSLICLEAGEDEDLFLFVVPRSAFRDAPAVASLQFERVGAMTTAAWSTGDNIYFLAGRRGEESLRQYLGS
jgi:hypothetical protein